MERRKLRIANALTTKDLADVTAPTGNLYESLNVVGERAQQIAAEMREEVMAKIEDFLMPSNTLDEVFENPEQIEISRYYERLPKAHLIALEEFGNRELFTEGGKRKKSLRATCPYEGKADTPGGMRQHCVV